MFDILLIAEKTEFRLDIPARNNLPRVDNQRDKPSIFRRNISSLKEGVSVHRSVRSAVYFSMSYLFETKDTQRKNIQSHSTYTSLRGSSSAKSTAEGFLPLLNVFITRVFVAISFTGGPSPIASAQKRFR